MVAPGESRRSEHGSRARGAHPARVMRGVAAALGAVLVLSLLAHLLANVGLKETLRALGTGGPFVVLAPLPFAAGMALDALGTVVLLRALGSRATFTQMFPVRIASEALHISLPAGFIASDTATAVLLASRCDVPMGDGIVALVARKWLVMRAHAAYIAIGAVAGLVPLAVLSRSLIGGNALPWAVLASAVIPLAASYAVGLGLLGRATFAGLVGALGRLPSARLRSWLRARRDDAVTTDAQAARLRTATRATTLATLAFFAGWVVEALESTLLLRLVGADIPFCAVIAVEGGLSLLRSLAVVAPPGLGIVDLGYATVLPAFGAEPGAAPAFLLLKRAKEIAWVAVGYAILAASRGRPAGFGSRPPEPQTAT